MKTMASPAQWMTLACVAITLMCLSTTYAASLHQRAQLVDSKEELSESFQLKSEPSRKVVKRQRVMKAPILLENDDEQFQLTVEDYEDKHLRVGKFAKQRVRRSATASDDGSGDIDVVYTTSKPAEEEEDGSGAVFGEDLTTGATTEAALILESEEVTEAQPEPVVEELIIPEEAPKAGVAKLPPKPELSSAAPEIEATTAEGNDTDTTFKDPLSKSSMRMAIIIAAIVGFWILLAPVICIVCRYRDRKNDKLNKKNKDAANHNILTPKSETPVTNGDVPPPEKYTKIDPDTKQPSDDAWESRQLNGKSPHQSQATRV